MNLENHSSKILDPKWYQPIQPQINPLFGAMIPYVGKGLTDYILT